MRIIIISSLFLITGLICSIHPASAQNNIREFTAIPVPSKRISAAEKKLKSYQAVKLPVQEIYSFVKGKSKASFRLNVDNVLKWDIELQPSHFAALEYKRTLLTPEGKKSEWRRPDYLYKGRTKNGGKVRLAIKEGFIYGTVMSDGQEYVIEPSTRYGDLSKDEYLLYTTEQIVPDTSLKCGVEEDYAPPGNKHLQPSLKGQSPQDNEATCRTIPILQVTDYQMLEQFNFNIDSLETFLFSNLNMTESVFNELNFGPDSTTDVGNDRIRFEVFETIISTCYSCDVITKRTKTLELFLSARDWITTNYKSHGYFISQFWSPRRLFSGIIEALGSTSGFTIEGEQDGSKGFNFLKLYTNDPVGLRYLTAHELGHSFGAVHDNELVSGMTQFFMTSYPVLSATRFSRATDFYSFPEHLSDSVYSRNYKFRRHIGIYGSSIDHCEDHQTCTSPSHLRLEYRHSDDSIKIAWDGNGKFLVTIYENRDGELAGADTFLTEMNSIKVKPFAFCKNYKVEVASICEIGKRQSISASITNTQISIQSHKSVNLRNEYYDLELTVLHNFDQKKKFYVFVDHQPFLFESDKAPQTVTIRNLFADGATHRLDISGRQDMIGCENVSKFQAPYYREGYETLLHQDFNNSCSKGSWDEDLLLPAGIQHPPLFRVEDQTNNTFFDNGNIDNTCLISYTSDSYPDRKRVALISPEFNTENFHDLRLSFDYQYWFHYNSRVADSTFFSVEVSNGVDWKTVFRKNRGDYVGPLPPFQIKNIWDTIPSRVFLDIDSLASKHMQVRFVIDNGTNNEVRVNPVFWALDNIRIDGLRKGENSFENAYKIFPNPSHGDIFIRFNRQYLGLLTAKVFDLSGREVLQVLVKQGRISVKNLPDGIYLLKIFENSRLIGRTEKFFVL